MMVTIQTVILERAPALPIHAPARCYVTATGEAFTGPPSDVPAIVAANLAQARLDLVAACARFLAGRLGKTEEAS